MTPWMRRQTAQDNILKIILSRLLLLGLAVALVAAGVSYIPHRTEMEEQIETPTYGQARNDATGTVAEERIATPVCGLARNDTETMVLSRDWSGEDEEMLLKMAMAEAESEGTATKALVILCVLNRVWSDEFPDSIPEVIYQENQFTPIWDGRYYAAEPDEDCYAAMELVKSGWDQSQGCMWYESTDNESQWHSENLEHVYTVGNMRFYREMEEE